MHVGYTVTTDKLLPDTKTALVWEIPVSRNVDVNQNSTSRIRSSDALFSDAQVMQYPYLFTALTWEGLGKRQSATLLCQHI
jgi:hypothetical protein